MYHGQKEIVHSTVDGMRLVDGVKTADNFCLSEIIKVVTRTSLTLDAVGKTGEEGPDGVPWAGEACASCRQ